MKNAQWPPNSQDILKVIEELFESGTWWIYKGEVVRKFEQRFAQSHQAKFGVSVCNGTVALDVALQALGIGPGDQVLLPAYNFYSLPKSVTNVGARPVFVDVCLKNLTIDLEQVQVAIKTGVKAIVAVHLSGSVAQMDELSRMCREANVYLIEDCAQAAGAQYGDRHVGSWGDIGLFSFGGVKLMTSGQGGMLIMSNPEFYEKCYALVNRGLLPDGRPNPYGLVGGNFQLSELAAVTLGPQLDTLAELCAIREQRMQFLDEALANIPTVTPFIQFPLSTYRAQMRYSFFYHASNLSRDAFVELANREGIPLMISYAAVVDDPRLFQTFSSGAAFPVAQLAQKSVLGVDHPLFLRQESYWQESVERLLQMLSEA